VNNAPFAENAEGEDTGDNGFKEPSALSPDRTIFNAMIKKVLKSAAAVLPTSAKTKIGGWYWKTKSQLLDQRLYQLVDLEYTLNSRVHLEVRSKGEWWVYNDIFVNREYDVPIFCMLDSNGGEALTVLDLGANVGYFALRIVDLMRQREPSNQVLDITMVEGSPATFRELERRLQAQKLPEVRSEFIHGLAGRLAGAGRIHESPLHVKNTIMAPVNHGGESVAFVDLEKVMSTRPQIDLLKCDIEGAELLVLENYQSTLLPKVKAAVFELHHDLCDTARCLRILEDSGFRTRPLKATNSFSVFYFSR
jgi:FkbM family methyltransferase